MEVEIKGQKMEEQMEKAVEEPVTTIKQKCVNCLRGPNLIKTLVILVCTGVVVQQISVCITKLIKVPITTYTHFDFNRTILYPSITFCKEPAFKFHKLEEYGLYAHPRYTSEWQHFNFSVDLDTMWEDITYKPEEFFVQYGLDSEIDNVVISSTPGFYLGNCHTVTPKGPSERASRESGYSITLQHHADDLECPACFEPPGYHVFVHYTREPFTEVEVYNGGLVDYFFVHLGELVDVKLTVDEYVKVNDEDDPCIESDGYSANVCTTECVWDVVSKEVGCSGPWMETSLPRCNNYQDMRRLISGYMNTYKSNHPTCHDCPRFCRALLYNVFITDRQKTYTWDSAERIWTFRTGDALLQAQLYIHFNSKMVSVYEERYNYDWNIFVSDLGGSVGFLLGLSVIGLMQIMEKIWSSIIRPSIKKPKTKKYNASVTSSTVTAKLDKNIDKDTFNKCNNWAFKNDLNFS